MTATLTPSQRNELVAELDRIISGTGMPDIRMQGVNAKRGAQRSVDTQAVRSFADTCRRAAEIADALAADQS